MGLAGVLLAVGQVLTLTRWDVVLDATIAAVGTDLGQDAEGLTDVARTSAEIGLWVGVGLGLAYLVAYTVAGWATWHGRAWGRVVLWVFGALSVTGVASLAVENPLPGGRLLTVAAVLLGGTWSVLLALRPSSAWFRAERERRRWSQALASGGQL